MTTRKLNGNTNQACMKIVTFKNLLVFAAILFAAGCQKEIKNFEQVSKADESSRHGSREECRMTLYDYYNGIDDFHNIENISYKNGKVDEWLVYYGFTYKMNYNNKGKLVSSDYNDGAGSFGHIDFIYKNGKVVKENWYDAATGDLIDEVTYKYNYKGQMTYNESTAGDYQVSYKYFPDGSLSTWIFYTGGQLNQVVEYTYYSRFKNPFRTLKGLDYCFVFSNSGFGIGTGERWYSSEKVTLYDENGIASIYYEQVPRLTKWEAGDQGLPTLADYTDKSTGLHITNSFAYENCKSCQLSSNHNKGNRLIHKTGSNQKNSRVVRGLLGGISR